jgi:hypothetical protein
LLLFFFFQQICPNSFSEMVGPILMKLYRVNQGNLNWCMKCRHVSIWLPLPW